MDAQLPCFRFTSQRIEEIRLQRLRILVTDLLRSLPTVVLVSTRLDLSCSPAGSRSQSIRVRGDQARICCRMTLSGASQRHLTRSCLPCGNIAKRSFPSDVLPPALSVSSSHSDRSNKDATSAHLILRFFPCILHCGVLERLRITENSLDLERSARSRQWVAPTCDRKQREKSTSMRVISKAVVPDFVAPSPHVRPGHHPPPTRGREPQEASVMGIIVDSGASGLCVVLVVVRRCVKLLLLVSCGCRGARLRLFLRPA